MHGSKLCFLFSPGLGPLLAIQYMHCKPVGSPPLSVIRVEFLAVFNMGNVHDVWWCLFAKIRSRPRSRSISIFFVFLTILQLSEPYEMGYNFHWLHPLLFHMDIVLVISDLLYLPSKTYLAWPPGELTNTM